MLQRSRILAFTTLTTVLLLFLGLEVRLFLVQVLQAPALSAKAARYQFKHVEVPVPRGGIYDAKGEALAVSIPALEVWVDIRYLQNRSTSWDDKEDTVLLLAGLLDLDADRIRELFSPGYSSAYYRPIYRNVTESDVILRLYALKQNKQKRRLRGIDLKKKYCRRYPHGELFGHSLGFVNHEGTGVFGIESLCDDFLKGSPGDRTYRRDGVQNEIFCPDERLTPGRPGGSVQLTMDTTIQFFAEVELAKIARIQDPKWAAAVVMEPSTGRILAAASIPALDPTDPTRGGNDHWINRPFAAQYPPGSTFKPLMMAMALDRGVVGLHESIDCTDGHWYVGPRKISDFHATHRRLAPHEILLKSSNVGISKIALRMVPEATSKGSREFESIRDTLLLLGFGKFPGVLAENQETHGFVQKLSEWTRTYTLASVSFGREIAVSPIQLAAAYCTLANDGIYVPPKLIERMESPSGREIRPPLQPSCRVLSAETCRNVREMMFHVVEEGSGKNARIAGIRVGGKTGTAEKLPARKEVTSSFVALAPVERPTLVVLVVVDEPKRDRLASAVAAPHVKAILERSLSHLNALCKK